MLRALRITNHKAKVIQSKKGPLLEIRLPVQPLLQLDQWHDRKQTFQDKLYSKYLFLPVHTAKEPRLCSTSEIVIFYYEPFVFGLDHQIQMRRVKLKGFDEIQLWYLLYTGVSMLTQFQKVNERVGKVCPQNILLNQKGQIRYVTRYSWPGQTDYYLPQTIAQRCYLSPEEIVQSSVSKRKADVFSLGIILVQCMTLNPVFQIYRRGTFDLKEFGLMVEDMNVVKYVEYSEYLKQTIRRILQPDVQKRANASDIFGQLRAYEGKIVRFQRFT